MKDKCSDLIGKKHLRIGVELDGCLLRVISLWEVDQPLVQLDQFARDLLVRVDVPGLPPFVEGQDDPRQVRGVYHGKLGHAFQSEDTGAFYITVPFTRLDDLRNIRIRVINIAGHNLGTRDRERMTAVFDDPPKEILQIFELDTKALRAHPDWGNLRGAPGTAEPEGKFEVYRNKEGKYHWRFVRFPGNKIACSCEGYDSREKCLEHLRWIRIHASNAPVIPTDLLGGADKCGEPTVPDTPSKPNEDNDECNNTE